MVLSYFVNVGSRRSHSLFCIQLTLYVMPVRKCTTNRVLVSWGCVPWSVILMRCLFPSHSFWGAVGKRWSTVTYRFRSQMAKEKNSLESTTCEQSSVTSVPFRNYQYIDNLHCDPPFALSIGISWTWRSSKKLFVCEKQTSSSDCSWKRILPRSFALQVFVFLYQEGWTALMCFYRRLNTDVCLYILQMPANVVIIRSILSNLFVKWSFPLSWLAWSRGMCACMCIYNLPTAVYRASAFCLIVHSLPSRSVSDFWYWMRRLFRDCHLFWG